MKIRRTIKCSQYPTTIGVIILTVVITAFFTSLVVSLWQGSSYRIMENELRTEIESLKSQIMHMGGGKDSEAPESSSGEEPESAEKSAVEIRFDNCGIMSEYADKEWYPRFEQELKEFKYLPMDISSACYSENGNMLVFIAQRGEYCEGPKVFKFDTLASTFPISQAVVINKGLACLGSLDQFGRRVGNVIKLVGETGDAGCQFKHNFDYDFRKNAIEIMRSGMFCEGDAAWGWTDY